MKVTHFKTTLVDIPLEKPIATAIHSMKSVGCVLLELETDEAVTGESYIISIEHMPWFAPLFNKSMEIIEGCISVPERLGVGFSFNQKAIRHFTRA